MAWNESKPSPTDKPNLELASLITQNRLAFRQAIEKHSFWTDSSGASAGVPRLSDGSFGPGSCRAYFDTASNVSSNDSATKAMSNRFYVTSDTTRLFYHDGLTGRFVLIGSNNALVYQTGSQVTIQSNTRYLVQNGVQTVVATSSGTSYASVVFTHAYNAAPQVQIQPLSKATSEVLTASLLTITASGFSVSLKDLFGATVSRSINWRSHGSVSLTLI